jgi:hypothetical protein
MTQQSPTDPLSAAGNARWRLCKKSRAVERSAYAGLKLAHCDNVIRPASHGALGVL